MSGLLFKQFSQVLPSFSIFDPFMFIKRTYQPAVLIRKRRHGFLARSQSKGGRRILGNRKAKGRWGLSA